MPTVKILPNGGTMYSPSPSPNREQPKRGTCQGWTRNVSRRNTDFLLSVQADQLTGHGYALSLTIRDCPETPDDWHKVRRAFIERLRRRGLIRLHWLTEWQRRGCPHIHAAVWFDQPLDVETIKQCWLAVSQRYGSGHLSQHVQPITGAPGWFEYLGKHADRSVMNYQRSSENVPVKWSGKTGRMWGHTGDWPTVEDKLVDVPPGVWCQYRRLMIRYQIARAKAQGDLRRVTYLQNYRSKAPLETSRAQAMPRVWIPEESQWSLLACAFRSHAHTTNEDEE